jgi:uncharacterized RDD family membrane protein YckC
MDAPGNRKGEFGCVALAFLAAGLCLLLASLLPPVSAALQALQVSPRLLQGWGCVFALLGLVGLLGLFGVAYVERRRKPE